MPPTISVLRFDVIVVAIGNSPARPAAIVAGMSSSDRMIASRKTTPTAPEIEHRRQDAARRLAARVDRLLAECPGRVEAVQDEDRHEEGEREGREHVAVLGRLRAERLGQHVGRLVVGEEQQDEREDEHPEDLGRDPDVVERRDADGRRTR